MAWAAIATIATSEVSQQKREELAGPTDTGQGLHSCIPTGRLWHISVLQCFSFQRKLLEKGCGTATQFPLDRKQHFSPTNCRFFLENDPRNESVKGTAQNRLLFLLFLLQNALVLGYFCLPHPRIISIILDHFSKLHKLVSFSSINEKKSLLKSCK